MNKDDFEVGKIYTNVRNYYYVTKKDFDFMHVISYLSYNKKWIYDTIEYDNTREFTEVKELNGPGDIPVHKRFYISAIMNDEVGYLWECEF